MKGYTHQVTVLKQHQQSASELLPRVHLVFSLLKRWLVGTHQGAVSLRHLDYYLDSLRSALTVANPARGESFSIACCSRP